MRHSRSLHWRVGVVGTHMTAELRDTARLLVTAFSNGTQVWSENVRLASQTIRKDNNAEIARLKVEYITVAKRVMDAIQQYGTKSEIFFRANADYDALIQRIKGCVRQHN